MLPPFRVRCLQRPTPPGRSIQRKYAFDAFVRVSAPEYDNTIRICPEASLKYLDDDDGETITVGSSLELIQRLESPSRGNLHYLPRKNILSSSDKLNFSEDELCPTTLNCHIFGIDCHVSSLKIWQEIRRRSIERGLMLQPADCPRRLEAEASSENEEGHLFLSDRERWKKSSSPVSSSTCVIAKDFCTDDLKVQVDESDDVSRLQELEDYRTACFQVRNLPQVKPSPNTAVSQETINERKSKMNYPSIEIPPLASAMAYPLCHLTLEGRRQAQAAGDKLRARSTSSRRKREITVSFDQAGYQNRWASYNDPISFHPAYLSGSNQLSNEQKLSSQGKRQPQLAGDKLRSRTNPVRHAKSLRGPTEHGVNKHRRCSLVGSRIVHCHDLAESSRYTESLESGIQRKNEMQPSLLQVFEAELANLSSKPSPADYKEATTNLGLPVERPPVPSSAKPHISAEKAIRDAKTSLNGMGHLGPQPCMQVLELALRATLSTFGACATQIANCMQEVSTTMRLADKTPELDVRVLENAVASFRNFTQETTALEKALHKEVESTEESMAKTDRQEDSSSLIGGQGMQSSCTVILWPIPNEFESREIQDILYLHTKQVKSVLISEAGEGGIRFAFCTVKDDPSAQAISRKMAGQMLNGSRLNVVVAPALEGEFARKENDVFKKTASERHFPSLVLRNPSYAAPQSTTSLPATSDESSGTINVVEELNQNIKPAATNLTFADHSRLRSDSKPSQPVSLLSNYGRSGNRSKVLNQLTDSVETATLLDKHVSNPRTPSTDMGDMQLPLKDTALTSPDWTKGSSLDIDKSWCTQSGSRNRTKLCSASILPIHNSPTNVLRYHGPGPLPLAPEEVPVSQGSSSPQNESNSKSHFSASHGISSPTDEYADPKLGSHLLHSPFSLAPDICGRELIRCSDQSLRDSAQPKVEDHLNTRTEFSDGRAASNQNNAVRACRSTEALFQHNGPVDLRQNQAGESITGKDRSLCAALKRNSSRMPSEPACDSFHEKKAYFLNYGARSPTQGQDFQASGALSKLFSLQNNAEVKKTNQTICASASSSDRGATLGESDQQPETSPLISRFPTLEQFEGRHFESTSRSPSTPSITALNGSRPHAKSLGAQSLESQASSLSRADSSDSVLPEVWSVEKRPNTTTLDTVKSSGEFFCRPTGLTCNSMMYHLPSTSPPKQGFTRSSFPVARKHPSQANIGTDYGNRLTHNVRRSATTSSLNGTLIRNNCRPYSENSGGKGRVTWSSFLQKDDKNMDSYPNAAATGLNQEAQAAHSVFNGQAAFAIDGGDSDEAGAKVRDISFAGEHSDAASVRKVEVCVSQLQSLGFGGDADGGLKRLVVYAQAADGDLVGAIDMIDEEQRAYRERKPSG